jgi:hypothetical protein
MNTFIEKARSQLWVSVFAVVGLASLTLGSFAWHFAYQGGPDAGGAPAVAARLAGSNGWETCPDAWRPNGVVFLVDPIRCQRSISVSSLQVTAPEEWEGIVRIEAVVNAAGEVDATGGFVWRGLWFFGDQRMLDRMLHDLR